MVNNLGAMFGAMLNDKIQPRAGDISSIRSEQASFKEDVEKKAGPARGQPRHGHIASSITLVHKYLGIMGFPRG